MNLIKEIEEKFIFDEFRDGQKECIEKILNAFDSGKRFVILEAPTGSGKSVIGMTISKFFNDAYYLTIQKILQDQLIKDFTSQTVKCLKGRNAYICNYWDTCKAKLSKDKYQALLKNTKISNTRKKKITCDAGVCLLKEKMGKTKICFPAGMHNFTSSTCPYWKAVGEAMDSHTCIMNFSSFLYQTMLTKRFHPRELMIIDEAHNTESQLMDFITFTITDKSWANERLVFPKLDSIEGYIDFFHSIQLQERIKDMIRLASLVDDFKKVDEWKTKLMQYDILMNTISSGTWVSEYEDKKAWRKITFKPIFVNSCAEKYLFSFGKKVLLMSATILDPRIMYDSLGINPAEAFAYRMKNRFPLKSRPIYFTPIGSMSYKNKFKTMPKMLDAIEKIADNFKDHKGIIHTHNFEIADYINNNGSSTLKQRLLYQKNFNNKDEMLKEHARKANGSIIIAPAMHEGVDLKHDLARFQIICKMPYPSFYDNKQLSIRMQLSKEYYDWLVALKLVQSYGRAIRSETDWAHTFILDEDFKTFMAKANKMLPIWFKQAIIQ